MKNLKHGKDLKMKLYFKGVFTVEEHIKILEALQNLKPRHYIIDRINNNVRITTLS